MSDSINPIINNQNPIQISVSASPLTATVQLPNRPENTISINHPSSVSINTDLGNFGMKGDTGIQGIKGDTGIKALS